MKLATPRVQVTSGGTAGSTETVLCGFAAETSAAAHLMRLLSDLYSNAAGAVLREYAVNARDSHIEAGNPDPVEVTLPTELNPVLVIADHGTGLSADDLIKVYSSYGMSTKRGSNSQTGAFGLGSKSAFTLSQQFIVTAVKDGELAVAAFGVNEDGAGTVTLLDRRPSSERNGVTVSIAVDDAAAVRRAAGPVFCGWEPGTVLVDGKRPRSFLDDPAVVAEGVYLAGVTEEEDASWGDAGLIIVMGGICYPVSRSLRDALRQRLPSGPREQSLLVRHSSGQRVFAVIGIGDADIAPSREELRDTARTLDRLALVAGAYCEGITATAQRMIDDAPTMTAAALAITELEHSPHLSAALTGDRRREWRGQPVAREVKVPYTASTYFRPDGKCEHQRDSFYAYLGESDLTRTLVITGVPGGKHETALRSAKAFLAADETYRRVVLTPPGAKPEGWFAFGQPNTLPSMPFEEYAAEARRRRPAPEKTTDPVRYMVFTERPGHPDEKGQPMTVEDIRDLGLPVVVARNRSELHDGPMHYPAFARTVHDDVAVVPLTGGRTLAALRRKLGDDVPVTSLSERADEIALRVAASWTSADRELDLVRACHEAAGYYLSPQLLRLRGRITNTDVTGVLDRMARYGRLTRGDRHRGNLIAGARAQWPSLFPPAERKRNLLDDYPLLQSVQYRCGDGEWTDHAVAYLNAVG